MFKKFIALSILLPTFSWAAPSPETVLTDKCLNSYHTRYKNKKNHKAFIYAREEDTGKNRCQWQYGADSVDTAIDKAIQACAKYQLNAECIVVDADGEYLVKDGDFSLITPVDKTPLTQTEKDELMNEASQLIAGNCLAFYKKSLKDKGHRVFAYSMDADGKYACGKSAGGNLISVRLSALKACKRNVAKRGSKKPKSECRIYAENKKILLSAEDYGVTVAAKEDKTLSTDEFNSLMDQAQQTINKGPCVFQMKYYLRGKQHQAFYLATNDQGKQSCGWTEGSITPEVAEKEALDKCKANARKQNLKAECQLFAKNFELIAQVQSEKPADGAKDPEMVAKKPEPKAMVAKPKPVPKAKPKKILTPEEDYKHAIFKGNLDKIKKHIGSGMDVNAISKDGISPLFVAAAKGDAEFFKQLLDKGADIKHKGKQGSDVLIAASFGANESIIRLLLDKGFDVNTKGREGFTPLHLALLKKNESLIKLLIKEGADASIKNDAGLTANDLAKQFKIELN